MSDKRSQILQALDYLHPDGSLFELSSIRPSVPRAPLWEGYASGNKGIVTGYFDIKDTAADVAVQLDEREKPEGIYVTLNPCNPALLARANHRLRAGIDRTKDEQITSLRHLLIDIDPERPTGISSADSETRDALLLACSISDYLSKEGWPPPLLASSGNGAHLIYTLPDLPNTPENARLVKDCLYALSSEFDRNGLKVDRTVFNPSRLLKLYGTTARKGDFTPERPHRVARIIALPQGHEPVPIDLLRTLAERAPMDVRQCGQNTGASGLDVGAYLRRYERDIEEVKHHGTSTLYVLKECVFDPSHGPKEAAIGQTSDGRLFYQCFHNGCKDRTWAEARKEISGTDDLKSFCLMPQTTPHDYDRVSQYKGIIRDACSTDSFQKIKLPERKWLIEPLIYEGQLGIIFGPAGECKTWCALGLGICASQGEDYCGPYKAIEPVGVVYVDGEMPAVELQDRIKRLAVQPGEGFKVISSELLSIQGHPVPNLADANWRQAFMEYLREHPEHRLLILDNLSSLTPGCDESTRLDWDPINQFLLELRRLGLTVLLIHHSGKSGDQRGTSAREDQMDLVLKLSRIDSRRVPMFKVEFKKARSLIEEHKAAFAVELADDGSSRISFVYRPIQEERFLFIVYDTSRGLKQTEIADKLGISQSQISKAIKRAKRQGLLDENGKLTELGERRCAEVGPWE